MNEMRKLIETVEMINESSVDDLMDDVAEFMNHPGNFLLYSDEDQQAFWQRVLAELGRNSERYY